jgi:hypothetical protein
MRRILALLTFVLSAALPAAGQVMPTITGNSITLTISRPGGLSAELSLSFEEVTGLSLANIGLSAEVVNPNDPALLARLPAGAAVALPVLLRIEPPVAGGLSFRGIASLGIHTENLQYTPGTPLRLFHAPIGGAFEDMTSYIGAGSYRVRGSSGGFSEFLIVADTRTVDQVIAGKFDRLEEELDEYAASMPSLLYEDLEARLVAARDDYEHGATLDAIQNVDGFLILVQQHSGAEIPDVWRSARDLQNVAGYLRAEALTLRFSLDLKRAAGN